MSRTDQDLDLTKIENKDEKSLASKIEAYYNQDSTTKLWLSYHWERNHLFLDGHQWIVHRHDSTTGRQWEPLQLHRANEYIPKPVTNYLQDVYQTLKSYLLQHRPRSSVRPNSQGYADKQAAKVAELIAECNWERLREEKNYEYAAANGLVYGTVFKKDYWDTTSLQIARVPRTEEQPIQDPMTGTIIGYDEVEVRDPETGDVVYDELPLGDVNSEVVEPYRIALDPLAQDMHGLRWIMEYDIVPVTQIRELYDREDEGFTGEAKNVKPTTELSNSLRRFYELKTSSGQRGTGFVGYSTSSGTDAMIENAAVVKTYFEQPSEKHPKGRMIVVAGGLTLYVGDSPYQGPEQGDWHPYSEFRWEVLPGRFWGKSPFDDAIEPQRRINSIDAATILTRKTMAIPQKLVPKGSGIKRNEWTGRPGQILEYRAEGGVKPETVPSQGVDPQIWKEREQCVQDIKQLTGAIDILKGDRPPGVTAASALEMLYEVGTGKLRPVLDRWKMFIESSQKKQLKLISRKYREPRPEFVKMLQSKNKDIPDELINRFIGTDLHDNCNVIIEAGSNVPKLLSARRARLMEAAQTGALQLEIPENRMQFLEELGLPGFDQDVSPDVKRAEWENDSMDDIISSPDRPPVVLNVDDHKIHLDIHARRMKEPSFMSLPEQVQDIYMKHIEEHQEMIEQEQQMREMAAQAGAAQPAPPDMTQPQGDLDGRGDGVPADTANALAGVDMPPDAKV